METSRYGDYFVFGIIITLAAAASYVFAVRMCRKIVSENRIEVKTIDVQKVMMKVQETCRDKKDVNRCVESSLEKIDKKIKELDDGKSLILVDRAVLSGSQDITKEVMSALK